MKRIAFTLLAGLLLYVGYVLYSTGYFRTIVPVSATSLVSIPIPGVEDIVVDEDQDFAIFISYDRAAERDGEDFKGDLFYMDLATENYTPRSISGDFKRPFHPHGIDMIQLDSNRHRLFVINHGGGEFIEIFDLYNRDSIVHRKSLTNELIYSPNDIVAIDAERFYFTNDGYFQNRVGQLAENYLGLAFCETVYFSGEDYRVAAADHSYANGINYDAERKLLYVAGVRDMSIKVYDVAPNGDLGFREEIDCGTGVDNIELDQKGRVLIGCHPNMIAADRYIRGKADTAPSEIIRIDYRSSGDYDLESIYVNKGEELSASTVAVPYQDKMLVGTVCDDHFVVLTLDE